MTAEPPASQPPVLVVDDEPALRELFSISLRRAGIPVITAADGEEALRMVAGEPVSLIVLDMNLPGRSGLEVLAAVKASRSTATLPVVFITGSGADDFLVEALEAGADDFIAKPVRPDELVARVRAHLRGQESWETRLRDAILDRARVVGELGSLKPMRRPEDTAEAIVSVLVKQIAPDFVSVLQLVGDDGLRPLAAFSPGRGVQRGGRRLADDAARTLISSSEAGPWSEQFDRSVFTGPDDSVFAEARPQAGAGAPIHAGERMVGILVIGSAGATSAGQRAGLLAAAIDYAMVLGRVAGTALDDRRQMIEDRSRLGRVLAEREYEVHFQPIVRIEDRRTVGFEALTRFRDGTNPAVRFAEAARAGLGGAYDAAILDAALAAARNLPTDAILSINVAPDSILAGSLVRGVERADRPLLLEVTEHAPIPDYAALRSAIGALGSAVTIAVDDAGAGYASLRHILELEPSYAKLDITIVRNVADDPLRQALVAGLVYFATATGCGLIAEGVETVEEAAALRRLGIELAQGFLFGRPRPLTAQAK